MRRIIGIPSNGPELYDDISAHFGHCEYFVGIEVIDENSFRRVFSLRNEGHSGCMEPVMNMRERNVTDMIVGGIGGRPFIGFQQIGIKLYQGVSDTIENNVKLLLKEKLKPLTGSSCSNSSEHTHDF